MIIRLPKVTVDRDEGDSLSVGPLSFSLILGFGLHWAWIYLTMFNAGAVIPDSFFPADSYDAGLASLSQYYLVSLATLAVVLLLYAGLHHVFRAWFATRKQRMRNRVIGAVLASAGTLLLLFCMQESGLGVACIILGGLMSGAGSAILLMSYGVSFSQLDVSTATISTALSLVVAAAVAFVVIGVNRLLPVGLGICVAIPFIEVICLYLCSKDLIDNLEFVRMTYKVNKPPFALRVFGPTFLMGFAIDAIRTDVIGTFHMGDNTLLQFESLTLAALLACGLLVAVLFTQRQRLNFLFRTLIPISAVILVVTSLTDGCLTLLLLGTLSLCCYFLYESAVWVSCADVSQRYRISAFHVFGFGRGGLAAGALVAALMQYFLGFTWSIADPATVAVVLCFTFLGYVLLPDDEGIRSLIVLPDGKSLGERHEVYEVADDDSGQTEETVETSDSYVAEHAGNEGTAAASEETADDHVKMGRFKRKCIATADRYLLSQRETEVLFLLAKGRNAAFIQEHLYISQGTARTHMRHVYKKLDVHTQQELMDLVDSTEIDD